MLFVPGYPAEAVSDRLILNVWLLRDLFVEIPGIP